MLNPTGVSSLRVHPPLSLNFHHDKSRFVTYLINELIHSLIEITLMHIERLASHIARKAHIDEHLLLRKIEK